MAQQLLAFSEAELGLVQRGGPRFPASHPLARSHWCCPGPQTGSAVDAVNAITTLARDRRIVMVNEAHHDAHSRVLTLDLLPRLRAMGFSYFAAEALDERDHCVDEAGLPDEQQWQRVSP